MRFQKLISAVTAGSLLASSLLTTGTVTAVTSAADENTLVFDLQSDGKNQVAITAEQIAESNVSVPVSIYVPQNPGVYAVNLKFQVNDGQVGSDGAFGNYGFRLENAAFASPYCFDSEKNGKAESSFTPSINPNTMNLVWVYRQTVSENADAYAEPGTTVWNSSNRLTSICNSIPKNISISAQVLPERISILSHSARHTDRPNLFRLPAFR